MSVIASDFEEEFDFSKAAEYQNISRPSTNENVISNEQPLDRLENKNDKKEDDLGIDSILPGFLEN